MAGGIPPAESGLKSTIAIQQLNLTHFQVTMLEGLITYVFNISCPSKWKDILGANARTISIKLCINIYINKTITLYLFAVNFI